MQKIKAAIPIALIMCLAALALPFAATADAAGPFQIGIDSKEINESDDDQTVVLNITLSNNPGIWGVNLDIYFDEGLTLTKVQNGKILTVATLPNPEDPESPQLTSPFTLYLEAKSTDNIKINGTLFTLTFTVPAGYTGEYDVTIDGDDVIKATDTGSEKVAFVAVDGKVTVNNLVSVTYDVDGGSKAAPKATTVVEGKSFKIQSYNGTKAGHTFGGWDYDGQTYAAGANFTAGADDICFVAHWNKIEVTGLTVSPNSISIQEDAVKQLKATVTPKTAVQSVEWESDDTDVATVDANGNVTGVSPGTAIITATSSDNPDFYATCAVTVTGVPVKSVSITPNKLTMSVGGEDEELTAVIQPSNAYNKNVIWTSSNSSVATVEDGSVHAVSVGTATITVKTVDGSKTAKCTVTVVPLVTVTAPGEFGGSLAVNETVTLSISVSPAGTSYKKVAWTSSAPKVASVDKNGVVKGISEGQNVRITATVDGKATGYYDIDEVTVIHATGITINDPGEVMVKQKVALSVAFTPDNTTNKNITWEITDGKNCATIDKNGNITGKAVGQVTVKATAEDKGESGTSVFTDTCTFNVVTPKVTSIVLSKTSMNMEVGKTVTITAKVTPNDAADKTLIWTSSDETVATVDNGKVTGLKAGTVIITATSHGNPSVSAECTIELSYPPVKSVKFAEGTKLTIAYGETVTLTPVVSPNGAVTDYIWATSDGSVATVSDGTVTAVSVGTAKITVTTTDGGKSATCTVDVVPLVTVTAPGFTGSLAVNETVSLGIELTPTTTYKKIVWTSNATKVASVDKNGVVKGVGEGQATITATVDGKASGSYVIDVETIHATSVSITGIPSELMIKDKVTLSAVFDPENTTNQKVTWEITEEGKSFATIDKNKGIVTGKAVGQITVKVTAADKGNDGETVICDTCTIEIVAPKVTSIVLSKTYMELEVGKSATLTAKVMPTNAEDKELTWSSSDPAKVSVDQNGRITAVSSCALNTPVTITVKNEATEVSATCEVYSKVSVKSVSIFYQGNQCKTTLNKNVGDASIDLDAVINPANATNTDVTWSSSNSSVVSVDEDGNLTFLKKGTAKITVTTEDGNKKATCTVKVS